LEGSSKKEIICGLVKEGARFLFGKEIQNLTSAEAAVIAALAKSPEYCSSISRLTERRNWILSRMKDAGDISSEEYRSGAQSPLVFVNDEARRDLCPEYVKVVTEFLAKEQNLEGNALFHAGLRVRTTCNIPMQEAARKAMAEQVKRIKESDGSTICIDPITREVTCMVAVGDLHPTKVNREPGSSFKAHTWAAAYAAGLTPETMVDDSPLTAAYKIPGSTPWQPGNHDGKYAGQINLRMAMAVSSNVVAARMSGESPGVESIRGMAEQAGIESDLQITDKKSGKKATPLSLAIGGMAVTPLEQANSYATYASGNVGNPIFVKGIRKGSGEEQEFKSNLRNAGISQEILGMVTYTLQGVIELPEGTAHSTLSGKFGEWKVVGKTGTTNSSRDAWFVGYTPNMVCLSWIGARGKSLGKHVYGGNSAAHAWLAPMLVATKGKAPQPFPYPLYQPGQPPAPVATTPVVVAPEAPATEPATPSAPTEEQSADKTSSTEDDD
jgi:penicillin-binding protein 1A